MKSLQAKVLVAITTLTALSSVVHGKAFKTIIIRGVAVTDSDPLQTDLKLHGTPENPDGHRNSTAEFQGLSDKEFIVYNPLGSATEEGSQPLRIVRITAYNPLGSAAGEGSQPRRRARSPAYNPLGSADGEGSQPRRKVRSPAYNPLGSAAGEGSQPRRRARSP